MKDIIISRNSKLFKLVSFLSELPGFSMFIKKYYNCSDGDSFNTFNDICTFSRHVIFSLIVSILYLLILAFAINVLIIQPLLAIFSSSLSGTITLIYLGIIFVLYLLFLIANKFELDEKIETIVDSISKKDSVVKSTFSIISKKHDNFCKRLSVKD